ncbi:MAG TPA: hypothetical protein VJB98_01095 [Candidatus Paceibacterota bacterium]
MDKFTLCKDDPPQNHFAALKQILEWMPEILARMDGNHVTEEELTVGARDAQAITGVILLTRDRHSGR